MGRIDAYDFENGANEWNHHNQFNMPPFMIKMGTRTIIDRCYRQFCWLRALTIAWSETWPQKNAFSMYHSSAHRCTMVCTPSGWHDSISKVIYISMSKITNLILSYDFVYTYPIHIIDTIRDVVVSRIQTLTRMVPHRRLSGDDRLFLPGWSMVTLYLWLVRRISYLCHL